MRETIAERVLNSVRESFDTPGCCEEKCVGLVREKGTKRVTVVGLSGRVRKELKKFTRYFSNARVREVWICPPSQKLCPRVYICHTY